MTSLLNVTMLYMHTINHKFGCMISSKTYDHENLISLFCIAYHNEVRNFAYLLKISNIIIQIHLI